MQTDGSGQNNTSNNHMSSDICTTPIAALSPYQNRYEREFNTIYKIYIDVEILCERINDIVCT